MKNFKLKVKKFLEEESADEYNGDTIGMYIGGTIGTLMMVAMILWGGMQMIKTNFSMVTEVLEEEEKK